MEKSGIVEYVRQLVARSQEGATGILTATWEEQTRCVYFREGHIAFASTSLAEERLGQVLVRGSRLAQEHLLEGLHGAKEEEKRLGEWLVENKRLSLRRLRWGLREQIELVVCSSLAWPEIQLFYEESFEEPSGFEDFGLEVVGVVLEGVRRVLSSETAKAVVNEEKSRAVLAEGCEELLTGVRIVADESRVMALVDGRRTGAEIASQTSQDPADVYRTLAGFALIGALEMVDSDESDLSLSEDVV